MSKLSANKCYVDLSMLQTTNPKIIYLLLQRSLRCNINLSGSTFLNRKIKYTVWYFQWEASNNLLYLILQWRSDTSVGGGKAISDRLQISSIV